MLERELLIQSTVNLEIENFLLLDEEMVFIRREKPRLATSIDDLFDRIMEIDGDSGENSAAANYCLGVAMASYYLRGSAADYPIVVDNDPDRAFATMATLVGPHGDGVKTKKVREVWAEAKMREHWLIEEIELVSRSLDIYSEYFKVGALVILISYLTAKTYPDQLN